MKIFTFALPFASAQNNMFFVLIDVQRSARHVSTDTWRDGMCAVHAACIFIFHRKNPHIVKYMEKSLNCLIVATLKPHNLQYPLPLRHRIT